MIAPVLPPVSWERMVNAVEKVRRRLLRAAAALEAAGIPYAATGGNAVAAHVSRVDDSAVRNTRDVDLIVRREDLPRVRFALEAAGFLYLSENRRHAAGIDIFLDGPGSKAGDGVHLLFGGEKVRDEYAHPAADPDESEPAPGFRVVTLDALVRMKLTSYRRKDQVHLLDMIGVGLIDETWPDRVPTELRDRLVALLEDPDG